MPVTLPIAGESVLRPMSARSIAVRLFFTCWFVYVLHFATNIVREIYLALAIGDHLSFRVDEYAHLHPDIFEKEGFGWHIDNTPGASMLAAIPYSATRPLIHYLSERVQQQRKSNGLNEPPEYDSPWPLAREFYADAWRRGLDIKLGLAAFVMQAFCMAPISALGVVLMFTVLRRIFRADRTALLLALLYAFGTPVFFRTGTLNQNLLVGHLAFLSFVLLWNPLQIQDWSSWKRFFLGGLAAGAGLLMDYSGGVYLLGLFLYGVIKRTREASFPDALRHACSFLFGVLAPVGLLWFYQWRSFGHPFYPPQHYMPAINPWVQTGYQGYAGPQLDLLLALAFDTHYGLFVSCPLLLLAFVPFFFRKHARSVPAMELSFLVAFFLMIWFFFSGSNYTRLQFNTGVRYLTAVVPFLFIPAALALMSLPRFAIRFLAIFSITVSWCLAMHRDVERGLGILDPILRVFLGGFELPALTTISRMKEFSEHVPSGPSPLPLFVLTAVVLYCLWRFPFRERRRSFENVPGVNTDVQSNSV